MVGIVEKIKEEVKKGEEELGKVVEKGEKVAKKVLEEVEEAVGVKPKKTSKSTKKVSKKTDEPNLEDKINNPGSSKSVEKKAEGESTTGEKSLAEKKKELLEKVKGLKEKVKAGSLTSEELKEKVKLKKKADMLVPLEEYVKAGIYLGTRVVTPDMRPFVYRRRADGLAIFNTDLIDEKLKEAVEFLKGFAPEDTILVCKRQAGWRVANKFGEITGIRVFTKKYPAGILTNNQLPDFFENELTIVSDQWVDKNALNDTLRVNKKVLMICDTNNFSKGASQIIIGNNKSDKSLGLIFYLLAKGYCKAREIKADIPDLTWWTGEEEEQKIAKRKSKMKPVFAEPGVKIGS